MSKSASKQRSNPIDVYVGARVRLRRKFIGMSQVKLGERLGLTFQQVQKYELGVNRISASKLYQTARALNVRVGYFFEGFDDLDQTGIQSFKGNQFSHDFLTTREGIEFAEAFPRIQKPKLRRQVVELVRTLANDAD